MNTEPASNDPALLRLLQLVSPALPVGAYAYSQGLESAIDQGWVTDEESAWHWIGGLLKHSLCRLDVPLFTRLYAAWEMADEARVNTWNACLYAGREAAELQREDHHLGTALARLLTDLGMPEATAWRTAPRVCFATLFSLAAVRWHIGVGPATQGYLWAWVENQVMAATRLIPLGQTAGQRLLVRLMPAILRAARDGSTLEDEDLGCAAPGLALASTFHETQYSRLFRS
ncbi:MAG: urease accessory protein UreF [Gammaproteobacteria bacterium]|nr:urease accessory protein UreF [Gammaproteobacteria bacterium]MCP5425138.1 urease accessory protein UreF [Gammaproteobacteria bacterium]MCP5459825.1 urease accessory protein UreF [Gammaproteobacteria bacterium]